MTIQLVLLNIHPFSSFFFIVCNPRQAFLDQMETDEEDEIALELQRRLEEVAAQQASKEPRPLNDLDSASVLYESTSFSAVEEETSFKVG